MKKLLSTIVYMTLFTAFAYTQSVDEILARYHESMGGIEKLKAVKSMKLMGKMPTPMGELAVTIYKKAPNLSKTEIDFQGNKMVQAYDGKTAWAINPMTGNSEPQKLEGEMANTIISQSEFEDQFIDYAKKGHEVVLEGKENIDGNECYKLKVTLNKNNDAADLTNIYYLDTEYMMPVLIRSIAGGQEMDTYLSDYQDIKDGIMMAFKMDIKVQGQVVQTIALESVEVDVPVDDSFFKFPGE
ncbi:MAG: outer membrane lipoprotein-sorting protein [Bacteroidales bacterium]